MPITISGSGTISGINAGGYPDSSVNTEDLNAGTASAGQSLVAAGASGAMSWGSSIVSGTAQNSTSGTAIDFTGIPSWVKRITVMFNGVSTSGTSNIQVQLASSGAVETSGYGGSVFVSQSGAVGNASFSTGFAIDTTTAATDSRSGVLIFSLVSSNIWAAMGSFGLTNTVRSSFVSGTKQLSAALDRVRITTVNGTDTFDAGSINIMYE